LAVYLNLSRSELQERATTAIAALEDCTACPRDCHVNRLENRWSACKTGRHALVSSAFAHFGEEDCLRGWRGSGTIFFSHCNLRCVFCQNYDISQAIKAGSSIQEGVPPGGLAAMMLSLQDHGCHNINFVTPEHVVPQIVEALALAIPAGLRLPLVYNTSAYDSLESLEFMDGLVDIYMPDFKYWSSEASQRYLKAADYSEVARRTIRTMHEQVGQLRMDDDGLATRGVLIRHLVMPGGLDETRAILDWITSELGRDAYVNLMDQYYPAGRVGRESFPEINRRLTAAEFDEARRYAVGLGLRLDERRPHAALRRRYLMPVEQGAAP
jgi:putative pyruvate formate lyase activating enzyme